MIPPNCVLVEEITGKTKFKKKKKNSWEQKVVFGGVRGKKKWTVRYNQARAWRKMTENPANHGSRSR